MDRKIKVGDLLRILYGSKDTIIRYRLYKEENDYLFEVRSGDTTTLSLEEIVDGFGMCTVKKIYVTALTSDNVLVKIIYTSEDGSSPEGF